MIKDMSDESYWELGKLVGAYLCGKKTLDEVMDAIDLMLAEDVWKELSESLNPVGGHGPASPYEQPLVAKTNLFSPA